MKIAVLGITGRTGRLVAEVALDRGHSVVGLARHPDALSLQHERLTVVAGDAHDPVAVRKLLDGCHAVVSALGPTKDAQNVCGNATGVALKVMRELGIKRYVVVSGAGIDFPGDQKGFADKLAGKIIRLLQPRVVQDKEVELALLRDEPAVEWVLVRPPRLVDGPPTGKPRANTLRPPSTKIRRSDLAAFLVDQVQSDEFVRSAPFVAN
jgi:putative NADH-flavin reductase